MGYYSNILNETATLNSGQDIEVKFKNNSLYTEATIKLNDIIEFENKIYKVINIEPYYPLGDTQSVITEATLALLKGGEND